MKPNSRDEKGIRILARRNRLLGEWPRADGPVRGRNRGLRQGFVRADFEEAGDEDVIRKVLGDLTGAGVDIDDARIREALGHKAVEARRQLIESLG